MKNTHEPGFPLRAYNPQVEFIGPHNFPSSLITPPSDFRERALGSLAGNYSEEAIQRIIEDGYDPTIIGYAHMPGLVLLEGLLVTDELRELKAKNEELRVLQEVEPRQIGWLKDFLADEAEYEAKGTVKGGKVPDEELVENLLAYRVKQQQSLGNFLTLWALENGIDVRSIEHPDVNKWIERDTSAYEEDEMAWLSAVRPAREVRTAVRRDKYGLEQIDAQRPDVILVGVYHAIKYDMLLDRDGQTTKLFLVTPVRWEEILQEWRRAH